MQQVSTATGARQIVYHQGSKPKQSSTNHTTPQRPDTKQVLEHAPMSTVSHKGL